MLKMRLFALSRCVHIMNKYSTNIWNELLKLTGKKLWSGILWRPIWNIRWPAEVPDEHVPAQGGDKGNFPTFHRLSSLLLLSLSDTQNTWGQKILWGSFCRKYHSINIPYNNPIKEKILIYYGMVIQSKEKYLTMTENEHLTWKGIHPLFYNILLAEVNIFKQFSF